MASLLATGGVALMNAIAFTATNYGARLLTKPDDRALKERLKTEKFQQDHIAWAERRQARLDAEAARRRRAQTSETHLRETDRSMVEYASAYEEMFNDPEPQLYMYHQKSPKEKKNDLIMVLGSITGVGVIAHYLLPRRRS